MPKYVGPRQVNDSASDMVAPLNIKADRYSLKKTGNPEVDRHLEAVFAPNGRVNETAKIAAVDDLVAYLDWHKEVGRGDAVEELRKALGANAYKTNSRIGRKIAYAMGRLGVEHPGKLITFSRGDITTLDLVASHLRGVKAALKSGESDGAEGARLEMTRNLLGTVFEHTARFRPALKPHYLDVVYEAITRKGGDGTSLLDSQKLMQDREFMEEIEWSHKNGGGAGHYPSAVKIYKALEPHISGRQGR